MISDGAAGIHQDPAPVSYDHGHDHGHGHGSDLRHGHGSMKHGDGLDRFSFSAQDVTEVVEQETRDALAALAKAEADKVVADAAAIANAVVTPPATLKAVCKSTGAGALGLTGI